MIKRKHVIVRETTYQKLLELKENMKAKSIDKVIEILIQRYKDTADIQSLGQTLINMIKNVIENNENNEKDGDTK
jgi:predicted CopG family antitoxin